MSSDLQALRQKQAELRQRLEKIEQDYRTGLEADSEERALQLENAEVLDEISRTTAEELKTVEDEIARLEAKGRR